MKRSLYFLILLGMLPAIWSCKTDGEDIYSPSTTTASVGINDSQLSIAGTDEVSLIAFSANFWWKASVEYPAGTQAWCTLSPSSGYGNVNVEVNTTRNFHPTDARQAVIVIESDAEDTSFRKEFVLHQAASTPYIEIDQVADGGTYEVPVTGGGDVLRMLINDSWTAVSTESWCRVAPSGEGGDIEFVVETDINTDLAVRTARVTVTAATTNGLTYWFDVKQSDIFAKGVLNVEKSPTVFSASWDPVVGAVSYEVVVKDLNGNIVGNIDTGEETSVDMAADPLFATPVHAGYVQLVLKSYSIDPAVYSESESVESNSHFTSGKGTSADPYIIGDIQSLINITAANTVAVNDGASYKLSFNPTLDGGFEPICSPAQPFAGSFDGDGRTISDWNVTVEADRRNYNGLFGGVGAGAKVENLKFSNCRISLTKAGGSVSSTNNGMAFVVGVNRGEISNVTVTGSYIETQAGTSPINAGSIAGTNHGVILNCSTTGGRLSAASDRNKSDTFICGGIAGVNEGTATLDGCVNNSTEILGMDLVGGIAGQNDGLIIRSANKAKITGNYYIGGIAGYVKTASASNTTFRIESSYNSGTVIMDDVAGHNRGAAYVGGIVSRLYSVGDAIVNCYCSGEIIIGVRTSTSTTPARVGGLVGHLNRNANIRNSYFSGTITNGDIANVGGIIGECASYAGEVENCYVAGEIVNAGGSGSSYDAFGSISSSVIVQGVYALAVTGNGFANTTTGNMNDYGTVTSQQLSSSNPSGVLIGWDFSTVWRTARNSSVYPYPELRTVEHNNKGQ